MKPEKGANGELYLPTKTLWEFVPDTSIDKGRAKITGHWEQVNELSMERQKKHHLDLIPQSSWEDLLKIALQGLEEERQIAEENTRRAQEKEMEVLKHGVNAGFYQ